MNRLYEIGLKESDVKNMIDACSVIIEMEDEEVENKINILKQIGCKDVHIKNILICNPWYLDRLDKDVLKLIDTLLKNKFECIHLLIDANPFILNLDSFEIEQYIKNKQAEGMELEDIVDELDANPILFQEM